MRVVILNLFCEYGRTEQMCKRGEDKADRHLWEETGWKASERDSTSVHRRGPKQGVRVAMSTSRTQIPASTNHSSLTGARVP